MPTTPDTTSPVDPARDPGNPHSERTASPGDGESRPEDPGRAGVRTRPGHSDSRLRGRTYAIPFDRVWTAALSLATESSRWSVLRADDQRGAIHAEAAGAVIRRISDITIRIGLDRDAQTRVDVEARVRGTHERWAGNPRRIRRFLDQLDQRLEATPSQILDPDHPPGA